MKLHEYQAKKLLLDCGLPVSICYAAENSEEAIDYAQRIGGNKWVMKVQVHAGARSKADGVAFVSNYFEIENFCQKWLAQEFVCPQSQERALPVDKLLIERFIPFDKEYYLSFVIDREQGTIAAIASEHGGVDIEDTATKNPDAIHKVSIDISVGAQPYQARYLARKIKLDKDNCDQFVDIFLRLSRFFIARDLVLLEINPLVVRQNGQLHFLDAKLEVDPHAHYRQKDLVAIEDMHQSSPSAQLARAKKISFVELSGDIGCVVNGAGLAMATMDMLSHYGAKPACFLDIGGANNDEQRFTTAFNILLENSQSRAVLVNVFTGFLSCLLIAQAIITVLQEHASAALIFMCLKGTDAKEAYALLQKNAPEIRTFSDMHTAAQQIAQYSRR